jgi:hypothetical protein
MSFSGTVESDFLKFAPIPEDQKSSYINFAATDFEDIKSSLLSYILSVYPEDYDNISESELGIMLLELVAYMGSVLSYKADALANESFITTVKSRNNMQKLLELIGVRMKGPSSSSARGRLSFGAEGTSTPNPAIDLPFILTPANRSFTVTSPEDGAPLSFTIYKLDSNDVIENIQNADDSIQFKGSESDTVASSVFTNMALVEGSLVKETGTFGSIGSIKLINLTDSPVIEKSVNVFVTDTNSANADVTGAYTEVNRLFSASGPTARIFEVIYDDDFAATVVFGDGSLGVNPPAGASYTVSYRVGGGSRGNLVEEAVNVQITDNNSKPWRLENKTAFTGGTNAESMAQARRYAPYTFKSQDRLVTLEDYQAFGSTFISSQGAKGKSIAVTRDAYSSANIIDMYILEKATELQMQKASPTFKNDLLTQIDNKKMLTDQVVVNDGLIRTLDLVITLTIEREFKPLEAEIKRLATDQVMSFFAVDNMDFGKSFSKVELERKLFQIPQIRFAEIENLHRDIKVDFNEIIQLNNISFDLSYL